MNHSDLRSDADEATDTGICAGFLVVWDFLSLMNKIKDTTANIKSRIDRITMTMINDLSELIFYVFSSSFSDIEGVLAVLLKIVGEYSGSGRKIFTFFPSYIGLLSTDGFLLFNTLPCISENLKPTNRVSTLSGEVTPTT